MAGYKEPPKEHQFSQKKQPAKKGRTKGAKNFKTTLEKYLKQRIEIMNPLTGEDEKKTLSEHLTLKLIDLAVKGNLGAMAQIINRIDGMPKQEVDLNNEIIINVTRSDIDD